MNFFLQIDLRPNFSGMTCKNIVFLLKANSFLIVVSLKNLAEDFSKLQRQQIRRKIGSITYLGQIDWNDKLEGSLGSCILGDVVVSLCFHDVCVVLFNDQNF